MRIRDWIVVQSLLRQGSNIDIPPEPSFFKRHCRTAIATKSARLRIIPC